MPGRGDEGTRRVAEITAAIAELYERIEAELSALPPAEAFARLTELRDALEKLRKQAAYSRARAASALYKGMSLAEVADTIGLTRARADQLIREARGRPRPARRRKARETNQTRPRSDITEM